MKNLTRRAALRIILPFAFTATVIAALAPLGPSRDAARAEEDDGPLQLVATTAMIGDALENVAGARAEVRTLMGEGVDPHLYRQTQADIAAMAGADAVFWNGLYLEAQLEEFLLRLGEHRPVFALAENVPREKRLSSADYEERFDPHVWMDPELWTHVVHAARDALSEIDPDGTDIYAANARRYLNEIEKLAAFARKSLETVPPDRRVMITAHDAFGYFGKAYGFEVIGIQGFSTESEAGLRQIDRLVNLIVERGIESIFVETSVSERNIRALIEGAAARGHAVEIGGQLFSDAMGAAGTYQGTYIGMIDSNVTTIGRALGGDVPVGGMSGRLVES